MKRTPELFFIICLLLCGCKPDISIETFSSSDQIRLEVNGNVVMKYVASGCQLAFNSQKCEFRVSTDTMSDYFIVRLSEIPSSEGQSVSAYIEWTTDYNIVRKNGITLDSVRIQGDKIWLWDRADKIGTVIKILE